MTGAVRRKLAEKRHCLAQRQAIIAALRDFFRIHDFLEIETPNRIPAPAPETHVDSFRCGDWFLHPSPELCMKRLLAAGYENIFQICKCYREGERGARHLPEFTLLEWYRAGADYQDLMSDCEELLSHLLRHDLTNSPLAYQGRVIDLTLPWERITVDDAFRRYAGMTAEDAVRDDLFEEVLVDRIEPRLGFGKPAFLYDYPLPLGSLAKKRQDNPAVAERFEWYLFGMEMANGFSELTDATEQRRRFEESARERKRLEKEDSPLPEPFLRDLTYVPDAAGIALGVDRLVMILTDSPVIDHVVAFTPEIL